MRPTNFYDIFGLQADGYCRVQRVGGKFVLVYEGRSGRIEQHICTYTQGRAHLLTGSLMATRKSCACSAIGEKASRII